jgi:hypothetical protein
LDTDKVPLHFEATLGGKDSKKKPEGVLPTPSGFKKNR